MDLSQIAATLSVQPGQPLRLENALGRRIAVAQGQVWVTQDADPRDLVLAAGEDFVIDRPGLTVLTALGGEARLIRGDAVAGKGGLRRFLDAMASLPARWNRARRAALARATLRAMSDHELADIGLQRHGCWALGHD